MENQWLSGLMSLLVPYHNPHVSPRRLSYRIIILLCNVVLKHVNLFTENNKVHKRSQYKTFTGVCMRDLSFSFIVITKLLFNGRHNQFFSSFTLILRPPNLVMTTMCRTKPDFKWNRNFGIPIARCIVSQFKQPTHWLHS